MDETQVDSNELFYGSGAGTSGAQVSQADLDMMAKADSVGAEVRDGDDIVEINQDGPEEDLEEDQQEDKPEETKKEAPKTLEAKLAESQKELEDIGADLKGKGIEVDSLIESFTKNGEFSAEEYKALADAGYSKAAVSAIVRGQQAMAQEATQALFAAVGGEAQFNALSEFAIANDPASVEAFNAAQDRGDVKTAQVVLKGIQRAYQKELGTANKQLQGRPAAASSAPQATGFQTRQEMVKAMSDSRYGKDLTYTAEVEQKVARAAF